MTTVVTATGDGVVRLDGDGGAWTAAVTAAGGRSWADCSLPDPDVYSIAVSAVGGAVHAGTEPSHLCRSEDGGASWTALDGLLELPSRPTWRADASTWFVSASTGPFAAHGRGDSQARIFRRRGEER